MLSFLVVSVLSVLVVATCPSGVLAAVAVKTVQARHDNDHATGLFGGIRPDGTFVFLYSETRGVWFYRVAPQVNITALRPIPKNNP